MAIDPALMDLFAKQRGGSLITLKRDGRPQASVVFHLFDADTRTLTVSITESRAKTRNLRRDPRASYVVTTTDLWGYAVGEGIAQLTAPAADPHDATVDALVDYYRAAAGEHPNWAEYRAAMVTEQRVLLTLPFDTITGAILRG